MMAMSYTFCSIMLLNHFFHQVEECIDIHIGIDLVLIDFPEVVKYPSVVFSNHNWFYFDLQKYNFFPIWQKKCFVAFLWHAGWMVADGCPQTALRLSGVNGMACRRHAVTQKKNTPLED